LFYEFLSQPHRKLGMLYSTRSSQAVSHPSTILAQCCLTFKISEKLLCPLGHCFSARCWHFPQKIWCFFQISQAPLKSSGPNLAYDAPGVETHFRAKFWADRTDGAAAYSEHTYKHTYIHTYTHCQIYNRLAELPGVAQAFQKILLGGCRAGSEGSPLEQ